VDLNRTKEVTGMSWGLHSFLLGCHILLAAIWVGGVLFVGWGVYPVVKKMPPSRQQAFLHALMKWSHWPLTAAGSGVIFTGFLLGTVLGPIREWESLWRLDYGQIWLFSLIVGLAVLAWGALVGYRQAMKVLSDDSLWRRAESGDTRPLMKAMRSIILVESLEAVGFIVLICLMLLF
jgi:putative copper export protein